MSDHKPAADQHLSIIPQPEADLVFVTGCPRSGTTWVMDILSSHPDTVLATPENIGMVDTSEHGSKESKLFIGPYFSELQEILNKGFENERVAAMSFAIGGLLLQDLADRTGKDFVVEKTPTHLWRARELSVAFPDCKLIGVLRDGRDACLSMLEAGKSWGKEWAPDSMEEAARLWAESVVLIKAMEQALGPERWQTVRYEELLEDTNRQILSLYSFIGLEISQQQANDIRDENEKGAKAWFPGLYRKGKTGGWREGLSGGQIDTFMQIAGNHLQIAGYSA